MQHNPFIVRMPFSAMLLLAAVLLTIGRFRNNKKSAIRLTAITLLAIISVAVIRMPIYLDRGLSQMDSTVQSAVVGIQTVGMGGDLDSAIDKGIELIDGVLPSNIQEASFYARFYVSYCIVQYALCPFLCAFALTKTITSALGRFWLRWFHRGPVFFFSDLTPESLLLAESIQKTLEENNQKAFICFASTDGKSSPALEAKQPNATFRKVLYYQETLTYKLLPANASYVNCILCHPSEKHNLNRLMNLLESSRNTAWTRKSRALHYFIFANSRHAEKVVDELAEQHIRQNKKDKPSADATSEQESKTSPQNRIICMLNMKDNLAMDILDKHPLFDYVTRDETGKGRLNVLIAGSTQLANRFLRNCIPCGQLNDCELTVTLADTNAEAYKQKLHRTVPMLANDSELIHRCVTTRFEPLSDPMAVAADELVKDIHYILLAYDDDKLNIEAARQIQLLIERQKLVDPERAKQKIAVIYNVEDPLLSDVCQRSLPNLVSTPGEHCQMYPVGNLRQQYSVEVLFGHELLRKAFFINCIYSDRLDLLKSAPDYNKMRLAFISFMNSSYDRRSSLAAALQIKYRNHVLTSAADPAGAERLLAYVEHYRWVSYSMLDGFLKPTDEQMNAYFYTGSNSHRSLELSLHPCMVTSEKDMFADPYIENASKDELDLLSVKVHKLAVKKLREVYADQPQILKQLDEDLASGSNSLKEKIESLLPAASENEKKYAKRLASAVFTNFKKSDMSIVQQTNNILTAAGNPATKDVLLLFWLNSK